MMVEQEGAYQDRAAVFGDVDNDGDIDAIVSQRSGDIRLLRNDLEHGLPQCLKVQGNGGNPKGLGAKLNITFEDGSTSTRWNTDGFGFQSSTSVQKHLLTKPIYEVKVTWPDGTTQTEVNVTKEGVVDIDKR